MIKYRYFTLSLLVHSFLFATWLTDVPLTITQPNGQIIECFVTGDQYARRIHDEQGYTIIMDERDGYYYYAKKNS